MLRRARRYEAAIVGLMKVASPIRFFLGYFYYAQHWEQENEAVGQEAFVMVVHF